MTKEEFPGKWCIKNDYQDVRDYLAKKYDVEKIAKWSTYEYIGFAGCGSHNGILGAILKDHINYGSIEITYDQFKEFVLAESDKCEKELLKNAYKMYPIGTNYICAMTFKTDIVTNQDFSIYTKDIIHAQTGRGCLYSNGKFAEIISQEENNIVEDVITRIENKHFKSIVSQLNKKQNEHSKEDNTSVKVQGYDFKVGPTNPIIRTGIKGTGNEIKLGSNHRYNEKGFGSCKS